MKKLTVEITSRCRLRCSKCARTLIGKSLKIYDMPVEDVRTVARTCKHEIIGLTGNVGDAIYHPKFFEVIDSIKKAGKLFELNTNGSGKDVEFWRKLFFMMDRDDRVVFSMDGLRDTCGEYRVGFKPDDFDGVIEAMKIGVALGKKIVWHFIPFKHNEGQIRQAAELAISIGVPFYLKMSNRWTGPDDPLMPVNKKLISPESRFLRKTYI